LLEQAVKEGARKKDATLNKWNKNLEAEVDKNRRQKDRRAERKASRKVSHV